MNLIEILAETSNGIGKTGLLDKFGNVFGIVLAVFGVIMILFSAKVKKMGSFYLEMDNHDPIIKETGYLPGVAKVVDRRSSEIAGRTFSEMQLSLTCDGETYFRWTPDLGLDGDVQIEYNPDNPEEFYIVDKVDGDDSPDVDEDGEVVEDLKEPPNKAFYAMLVFGIVLLALGCGFLYDFYFIK
jgi:hypothetical protein